MLSLAVSGWRGRDRYCTKIETCCFHEGSYKRETRGVIVSMWSQCERLSEEGEIVTILR